MVDSPTKTLRVLFAASEADPIIKVGGLGDVTGSLPRSLMTLEPAMVNGYRLDVRLVIPFHSAIAARIREPELVTSFSVPHPNGDIPARAFLTHVDNLPVYLISGPPIPADVPVYSQQLGGDGVKYVFFSLAVLELARALDWAPDILHAHDWHTALSVYSLMLRRASDPFFARTRAMLTVHNLPYMGAGTESALASFGIPSLQDSRLPPWGNYQPLPMGLSAADMITTVSPTYAREIMTPAHGCDLQDFLQMRAGSVTGILNGLDESLWDPATDQALVANFDAPNLEKRAANKQALLREFNLQPELDLPLLAFIGRFEYQKGVDVALAALRQVADLPWQAVILGTGDPELEASTRRLEAEFPFRARAVVRFDSRLARQIYASSDILLMPSRYEPCGLAQMIAMRYGSLPVARATGGLRDTITDNASAEHSTGFLFEEASAESMAAALRRAITAYADPKQWQAMQMNAMRQDFAWQRSAQTYALRYVEMLE